MIRLLDPLADTDAVESGDERATDEALDDTEDPLEVALSVVTTAREDADAALEARLAAWLAEDPEHWSIFRLVLFDAWRDERGGLEPTVPSWVRVLTTSAALAHFQQDPYGRQRAVDLS